MSRPTDTVQIHIGAELRRRLDDALAVIARKHTGPASEIPTRSSVGREAMSAAVAELEARAGIAK